MKFMTITATLKWSTKQLKRAGIASASLDAEILLSFVLKKPREFIFSHPEKNLKTYEFKNLKTLLGRRARGEPIAYIVGEKEFYNLKFKVNRGVLIPRPETELIVDLVLPHLTSPSLKEGEVGGDGVILIDVGTGSGCIPIAIAKNSPCLTEGGAQSPFHKGGSKGDLKIFATEISQNALKTARQNAKLNGVSKKITFLRGNLLKPFLKTYKLLNLKTYKLILTANLPYIPTAECKKLPPNIKNYEPRSALDGGIDGLKYYRQLFKQLTQFKNPPHSPFSKGGSTGDLSVRSAGLCPSALSVFLEIDPRQKTAIQKIILKYFAPPPLPSPSQRGRGGVGVKFHKDLAGKWRVAEIKI